MGLVRDNVELLQDASPPFDLDEFLAGQQSPVFFGSGINNFGVQEILQALIDWAPPPQPRDGGKRTVQPAEPAFSVRWVQIDNARFEFVRMAEDGSEELFELSDLDFQLRDFAPNRPFRMDGSVTIGKTATMQFELSGPAPADYEG